jgi:hypothetical protein
MKTRLLLTIAIIIIAVIILTGLIFNFFILDTLNGSDSGTIFPQPQLKYVLVATLENDFNYDALSFKEKTRNLLYAKTILVDENDLLQFPSLLSAIGDIGKYNSFPNKGYSDITVDEIEALQKFIMITSKEQTGIADSSYYSLKLQDNIYHIDYNFHHYPANDLFLFVYSMDPQDTTTQFVEIEDKDFVNVPIIGEVLIKKQFLSENTIPKAISVKDQVSYQKYLDSKFEEKYGSGTAPFGINHILFVDENSNAFRIVVQFERIN